MVDDRVPRVEAGEASPPSVPPAPAPEPAPEPSEPSEPSGSPGAGSVDSAGSTVIVSVPVVDPLEFVTVYSTGTVPLKFSGGV